MDCRQFTHLVDSSASLSVNARMIRCLYRSLHALLKPIAAYPRLARKTRGHLAASFRTTDSCPLMANSTPR